MAITNIIGWASKISGAVSSNPLQAYWTVGLTNRCVNLVSNTASTAPLELLYDGETADWPYRISLKKLMRMAVKDLVLHRGTCFLHKQTDGRGNVINLKRLNPYYMTVELDGESEYGEPIYKYAFQPRQNKQSRREFSHDEIIYIKLDCDTNDVYPDSYPAKVAFGASKVLEYLQVFGEVYFESGAMSTSIIALEGNPSPDDLGKFNEWIKRRVSGVRKAFGVIAVRAKMSVQQLNPVAKDLAIPELDETNRKRVLDAFGVPEGMIEKNANYASAETHTRQFWDSTIKPIVELVLEEINEQLFFQTDYELVAYFEELPVYQVDEGRRSAAAANLVNAGFSREAVIHWLGYADLPDDIPMYEAVIEPEPRQLGEPKETDSSMIDGDTGEDDAVDMVKGVANVPSMFTHLDQWRNKAKNRVRQGKSLDFNFESDLIPEALQAAIKGHLVEADDDMDAIREIFDHAVNLHHAHSFKGY